MSIVPLVIYMDARFIDIYGQVNATVIEDITVGPLGHLIRFPWGEEGRRRRKNFK